MTLLVAWLACGGGEPAPVPVPPPPPARPQGPTPAKIPSFAFRLPEREGRTPAPLASSADLVRVRGTLEQVVRDHALDPGNPWAIVHGTLALGWSVKLSNGADPVDWLFSEYAELAVVGDEELVRFPPSRGAVRIEPHTDLVLKALTEGGVPPDRAVTVKGAAKTVGDLYRHSLSRAWAQGTSTGFQEGGYNDTPWALQGLAAWAPDDLAWLAPGRHDMTMDGFTSEVVDQLVLETKGMREARAAGTPMQKDTRKGLFRYTCGGQHLVQGAAYAVGRGFGRPEDAATICDQLALLRWRIDVELGSLDPLLAQTTSDRAVQIVLLTQRLKFLGHWLETTHKIGALGVCPLSSDDAKATERVAGEVVQTVDALAKLGVWSNLGAIRTDTAFAKYRGGEQVYLDLVGDSAHAVRGIDLATGRSAIRY